MVGEDIFDLRVEAHDVFLEDRQFIEQLAQLQDGHAQARGIGGQRHGFGDQVQTLLDQGLRTNLVGVVEALEDPGAGWP